MWIRHKFHSLYFRAYSYLKQKTIQVNGCRLHYILYKRKRNDKVIVIFSGFSGHYKKGRYNYLRSLNHSSYDRIYLRDDFGFMQVGSYYLGDHCKLQQNEAIQHFLSKLTKSYKETIFVGTSKGGTSALYYGLLMHADKILIGSPQYRIGDYLSENEYHQRILDSIINIEDGIDKQWLNFYLEDLISRTDYEGCITMVFSSKENGYSHHIEPLISKMLERGFKLKLHDEGFDCHSDIGIYFKKYLANY